MGCGASVVRKFDAPQQDVLSDNFTPEGVEIITQLCDYQTTAEDSQPYDSTQDFTRLTAWCVQTGQKFVDPEFFPQDSSVSLAPRSGEKSDLVWLRPGEICRKPRLYLDGASTCEFSATDTEPNTFMTVCSFIASQPHIINRIIPEMEKQELFPEHQYNGIFHIKLYNYGEWTDIIIDDYLPTCRGKLLFCRQTTRNEFWPALLEKAYAKLLGNYELLANRPMIDILEILTGVYGEKKTIPPSLSSWQSDYTTRKLFTDLIKAHQCHSFISIYTSEKLPGISTSSDVPPLKPRTMYTVRQVVWVPFEGNVEGIEEPVVPMLRLYNPWGHIEITGPWMFHREEWNSTAMDVRDDLGLYLEDEGEFWITYADLLGHFEKLSIFDELFESEEDALPCLQHKGLIRVSESSSSLHAWGDPQFLLDVESEGSDLVICFDVRSESMMVESGTTSVSIFMGSCCKGYRMPLPQSKAIVRRSVKQSARCVLRTQLRKGRYVVKLHHDPARGAEDLLEDTLQYLLRVNADGDALLSVELSDTTPVTETVDSGVDDKKLQIFNNKRKTTDLEVCVHCCVGLENEAPSKEETQLYCMVLCNGECYGSDVFEFSMNPVWDFTAEFYDLQIDKETSIEIEIRNREADDELLGTAIIGDVDKKLIDSKRMREIHRTGLVFSRSDDLEIPGTLSYSLAELTP